MSARWFNIDTIAELPEYSEDAMQHLPWGYNYYEGDDEMQDQLENEWSEYRTDFPLIEKQPINIELINMYGDNGARCIEYFESKAQQWELLSPIAIRTIKCVISTADVERIFSIYNYYLGQLDAVNLGIKHKKAKAFVLQNKKHI
eukprot:48218_1